MILTVMVTQIETIEEAGIKKGNKMKKKLIVFLILLCSLCYAAPRTFTQVKEVEGSILHSIQNGWVVVDETTSTGTEPSALAVGVRTKLLVEAAIDAASSGNDEISTFIIPSSWNAIRFRSVGITDNDTQTYQIYLGTIGSSSTNSTFC